MYRQVFTAANLVILKYMYHPSIKIFQYFQKSKFSDIKYCIFKKQIVYIPSFSTK